MKKIFTVFALTFFWLQSIAQLGVNTDGSQPDSSAILDVKSSSMGFLPPRMTQSQMNAIKNPSAGLMVFCTDCGAGSNGAIAVCMAGAWWTLSANCLNPLSPNSGSHSASENQLIWNWSAVPNASGYKWNTVDNYATAEDMAASTTKTEVNLTCLTAYTRYVWAYSSCGVSVPVVLNKSTTGIQVLSPAEGTHVASPNQIVWNWQIVSNSTGYKWNTSNDYASAIDMGTATTHTETALICSTNYSRYVWAYNACTVSPATMLNQTTTLSTVNEPVEGAHTPSTNQIAWAWSSVPNATGYKWNTTNDYNTAIDMGASTNTTETGLNPLTNYTRYVWAYDACTHSNSVLLNCQTLFACGASLVINHSAGVVAPVSKTVTYGTVGNIAGTPTKCWITSNLGADHQASAVNDATEASAGWYWQFNRKQGYKHDGSSYIPATAWIVSIYENSDWLVQNNPCTIELGSGWRLPTWSEWDNVKASGGWTNWNGPWGSNLKLHAAGSLLASNGSLQSRGGQGVYWSGTQGSYYDGAINLLFGSSSCTVQYGSKTYGETLRCIKD